MLRDATASLSDKEMRASLEVNIPYYASAIDIKSKDKENSSLLSDHALPLGHWLRQATPSRHVFPRATRPADKRLPQMTTSSN
jgi:hypothetical protein